MTKEHDISRPRYYPGDAIAQKKHGKHAAMLRVNHAGEYGAIRIYEGQLSSLKKQGADNETLAQVQHMADQEQAHLKYFQDKIGNDHTRPTALFSLWHYGAYAMGAFSAMLGTKGAMACTVAVEDVIGEHYQEQIDYLNSCPPSTERDALLAKILQFQAEELEHHDTAIAEGGEDSFAYKILHDVISRITKTAVWTSYRL